MPLEYTATEKTISSHEIVSEPFVDRNLEKRILRKLDLHLIPIISCLYLLSFLDRGLSQPQPISSFLTFYL